MTSLSSQNPSSDITQRNGSDPCERPLGEAAKQCDYKRGAFISASVTFGIGRVSASAWVSSACVGTTLFRRARIILCRNHCAETTNTAKSDTKSLPVIPWSALTTYRIRPSSSFGLSMATHRNENARTEIAEALFGLARNQAREANSAFITTSDRNKW